jgi:hypothetical protein
MSEGVSGSSLTTVMLKVCGNDGLFRSQSQRSKQDWNKAIPFGFMSLCSAALVGKCDRDGETGGLPSVHKQE